MPCATNTYAKLERSALEVLDTIRLQRKDKGHEVVRLFPRDRAEAVEAMALAFAGTATTDPELMFNWSLGKPLYGKWDDPARLAWMRWYMEFTFNLGWMYGLVVGVRDLDTSKLMSVTVVLPPGRTRFADSRSFCKPHMLRLALMIASLPPDLLKPSAYPPHAMARLEALNEQTLDMKDQAERTMLGDVYWYILVQAVSPSFQGRGCTRTALDAVAALANSAAELPVPCYLEAAGERNMRIYAKLGYTVVEKVETAGRVDPRLLIDGDEPPPIWTMQRPPAVGAAWQ